MPPTKLPLDILIFLEEVAGLSSALFHPSVKGLIYKILPDEGVGSKAGVRRRDIRAELVRPANCKVGKKS